MAGNPLAATTRFVRVFFVPLSRESLSREPQIIAQRGRGLALQYGFRLKGIGLQKKLAKMAGAVTTLAARVIGTLARFLPLSA